MRKTMMAVALTLIAGAAEAQPLPFTLRVIPVGDETLYQELYEADEPVEARCWAQNATGAEQWVNLWAVPAGAGPVLENVHAQAVLAPAGGRGQAPSNVAIGGAFYLAPGGYIGVSTGNGSVVVVGCNLKRATP